MKPRCKRPQGRVTPGVNFRVIYAAELLGPLWLLLLFCPTPAPAPGCLMTGWLPMLFLGMACQESKTGEGTGTLLSPAMSLECPREHMSHFYQPLWGYCPQNLCSHIQHNNIKYGMSKHRVCMHVVISAKVQLKKHPGRHSKQLALQASWSLANISADFRLHKWI